jgi:acyl-coenzyme A thioesterase PaaI-like protein
MQTGELRARAIGDNPPITGEPMLSNRWRIRLLSLYPPYLGAGVRVRAAADLRTFEVRMKLRWWNRNYVGTQFGGSLYSMCDPFFMLILFAALGRDYVVWDKAATIRFRRPGRGTVEATFHIPQERIDEIRAAADAERKVEPVFTVEIVDEQGEVVAEVEKLLYVRRKTALSTPSVDR